MTFMASRFEGKPKKKKRTPASLHLLFMGCEYKLPEASASGTDSGGTVHCSATVKSPPPILTLATDRGEDIKESCFPFRVSLWISLG